MFVCTPPLVVDRAKASSTGGGANDKAWFLMQNLSAYNEQNVIDRRMGCQVRVINNNDKGGGICA